MKVYDVACRLLDDGIQGVREEISKLRKQLSLLGQQETKALDAKLKAFSEERSLDLKKELKEEYLKRYKERGSPEGFIKLISDNWDLWLEELKNQKGCKHIELESGQFMANVC